MCHTHYHQSRRSVTEKNLRSVHKLPLALLFLLSSVTPELPQTPQTNVKGAVSIPKMRSAVLSFASLAAAAQLVAAEISTPFSPPSTSPTSQTTNYTGASNGTLTNGPVVAGKSFDRFIQIWLENTDFATAASSPTFQKLAGEGVTLTSYYGVTHPSEPNYIAAATGDFFGLDNDQFRALPKNVSTIVDLLEAKNISWASYQENMPYDGFTGFNYTENNYLTGNASQHYTYYVRKHNPTIICNSVAGVESRGLRHRNFNDLAADVTAGKVSQWVFITPNLVNDAHDTNIDFTSAWLEYFLAPLLQNPNFNDNRTLILLTFDENETYTIANQIWTLALGGALPSSLMNKTDDNYYTHYSSLSTVEANWGLGTLGRGDANKTMNNVYSWVANATDVSLNGLTGNSTLPLTNLTGVFPGPLNADQWTPVLAPAILNATSPTGGAIFVDASVDRSLTSFTPINLTALGVSTPQSVDPGFDYSSGKLVLASVANANTTSSSARGTATGSSVAASTTTKSSASGAEKLVIPATGLFVAALALVL
ncbi:hypothetical protein MVLG_00669 [Microbotryum lychnidis-dioicae p1A1 Lamole]|uniref:Acid phosphatase n=1 Tax=Microbotryum lychnidis-dioicae (strain p1A1 Lamole / MvSl-1064) TaxID=683840 RepID=U5GZS3_USTV1|nr:hypothetical protein MVLG_00669 [Microbotryum lychnidis-dioicae p1A1 Lamole]|eukprot:KDE09355.1 hypothetical protein MVLG_00669 [Microbotryum lychnidis-dioicae p1A1 Lamole]